jgi:hypothetical protein
VSPDAFLEQGASLLASKLEPLGYRFQLIRTATGSGGPFAEAAFSLGERQIILFARYDSLGGVRYSIGSTTFDHGTYMAALGKDRVARYPGLPDEDKLGGFRRLLADLELCGDFFDEDATALLRLVASMPPARGGFSALSP